MSLADLIRGKSAIDKFATATSATFATQQKESNLTVASVATVTVASVEKNNTARISPIAREQETAIKAWLTEIGEPEADHYLVLSKCKRDPEALAYFLELAAKHFIEKNQEKVP